VASDEWQPSTIDHRPSTEEKRNMRARVKTIGIGVIGVIALGGALRLYRVDALSLWVDEGLTVLFARLPWPTLLGFGPVYSLHPPLYFALVKLLSLVCPELMAGRLLSMVAATLTLPILYLLGARLAGPRAGTLAALVLALSPLHIWYAREARPYALVALLIALCYLALVAVLQGSGRLWIAVYASAAVAALYTEDSAVFALAPQTLILLCALTRRWPRARLLALTFAVAACAFIPWLPHLFAVVGTAGVTDQFALSPGRVAAVLLSVVGLSADGRRVALLECDGPPPLCSTRTASARPTRARMSSCRASRHGCRSRSR